MDFPASSASHVTTGATFPSPVAPQITLRQDRGTFRTSCVKVAENSRFLCPPWMTSRTLKGNIQGIHVQQKHDFKTQKTLKEIKKKLLIQGCHPLCRMLSYPTRNGSSPHLQTCLWRFVSSAFERTFLRPAKGAQMSCFPNFKKKVFKKSHKKS